MSTQSFEHLLVWQKAHQYVLPIYRITKKYPKEELFCLVNQMRRAAVSIAANIAEGYIKMSSKDKLRFYNISQGPLEEIRNFIILSHELNEQAMEVSKLLNAYCKVLITNCKSTT